MYYIIEVANTHGGSASYLNSLIEEFQSIQGNVGIKFQPFKFDRIALPDYEWYPVYEKLFFEKSEWNKFIDKASQTKDVWLDLFDSYGVEILNENHSKVYGLKLQTSVLENHSLINDLRKIDLSEKKLIINVAGREIDEILNLVRNFEANLNPNELLIEVGFQAYPTKLVDSGLAKIKQLKEVSNKRIVFADHISGEDINAKILPIMAVNAGAEIIEKHVMHSSLNTEYDHFSSIKVEDFKELINLISEYADLRNQPFINQNEIAYLNNSIQVPILKENIQKGASVSLNSFDFKRTGLESISYNSLIDCLEKGRVKVNKNLTEGSAISIDDLSNVNVACIVAARLKSSRLKEKAKLKIGNISSVELCLKNCLKFEGVNHTILATSTTEQDYELRNFTYSDDVIFHQGHPEDVIQRYLDIIDKLNIDVFVRVTGDMPYVSKDIQKYLLTEHFRSGADYTVGRDAAVGTNLEIINTEALRKVKSHFPEANYSEYMTWYFQNNPEHFELNFVDLPKKWVRDYRLTIDYQEDLDLFNQIEEYFEKNNLEYSIEELFKLLDGNSALPAINNHITLKYKTDQTLINALNEYTRIKANL